MLASGAALVGSVSLACSKETPPPDDVQRTYVNSVTNEVVDGSAASATPTDAQVAAPTAFDAGFPDEAVIHTNSPNGGSHNRPETSGGTKAPLTVQTNALPKPPTKPGSNIKYPLRTNGPSQTKD